MRIYLRSKSSLHTGKGLCEVKTLKQSVISLEVGGRVQVSLGSFYGGKLSKNSPKLVLIRWAGIPRVFCLVYMYVIESC